MTTDLTPQTSPAIPYQNRYGSDSETPLLRNILDLAARNLTLEEIGEETGLDPVQVHHRIKQAISDQDMGVFTDLERQVLQDRRVDAHLRAMSRLVDAAVDSGDLETRILDDYTKLLKLVQETLDTRQERRERELDRQSEHLGSVFRQLTGLAVEYAIDSFADDPLLQQQVQEAFRAGLERAWRDL